MLKRKAITTGQTVYNSDKEFLKNMQRKLDAVKSAKTLDLNKSKNDFSENKNNNASNKFKSELVSIQNSISELKNSDSKINDNLELLSLSREVSSQITIDKSNSFGSFSKLTNKSNANLFSLLTNNPISKKISNLWS